MKKVFSLDQTVQFTIIYIINPHESQLQQIIIWFQYFSFASIGFCNAIIWGTSDLWQRYKRIANGNSYQEANHGLSSYTSPINPSLNVRTPRTTNSTVVTYESIK